MVIYVHIIYNKNTGITENESKIKMVDAFTKQTIERCFWYCYLAKSRTTNCWNKNRGTTESATLTMMTMCVNHSKKASIVLF